MFASIYKALSAIGYSHPIHTPMTSLPLGMVMGALVFALVGFASKRSGIRATACHCATLASPRSKRAKYGAIVRWVEAGAPENIKTNGGD